MEININILFFVMKRIKLLIIEYDGTQLCWMANSTSGKSIQFEIEKCLKKLFNQPILIICSW